MSLAFVTMDSTYTLQLHHRHHVVSPESHVVPRQDRQPNQQPEAPLRFSVVNILRPEFGREALLTKQPVSTISLQLPHSPLPLPRDLSLSSTRLSPQSVHKEKDNFPSHNGLTSPLHRQNGLSRSGSLESLASSRSSVTSSTVTGPSSLCSTSSVIGGDSLNSDNNTSGGGTGSTSTSQSNKGTNGQLWPAWVYCTRYSDRPSSGKFNRHLFSHPCINISHKKSMNNFQGVNNRCIKFVYLL